MSIDTPEVPVAEAEKPREDLFKWSDWVHVGDGADECPARADGSCSNPGHFHAWVRLPNPFQARDIVEKARAAQARYRRMLRDPDSDERLVIEDELAELAENEQSVIVDEVIDQGFADDYEAAIRDVADIEDPDYTPTGEEDEEVPKLYAHIDQDREEYNRQRYLSEEQRTEDFPELEKTVAAYGKAIEEAMERRQAPRREALMQEDPDALIERIRRERLEHKATEVYLHHYSTWQWYVCTLKPRRAGTPNERVFKDITQMRMETPSDVIFALRATYDKLERDQAADRRGKGS